MQQICPILGRSTYVDQTQFGRDLWSIVRCRETGFVFLANPPDFSQLQSELAWEETSRLESERRRQAEPFVSRLSAYTKRLKTQVVRKRNKTADLMKYEVLRRPEWDPVRLLDIGCGAGIQLVDFQQALSELGRQVVPSGIEISRNLAQASKLRVAPFGGEVICDSAETGLAQFTAESLHVVTMVSFLEHYCEPLTLLKQVRALLVPEGKVVLKVPNFACWNRMLRSNRWCGFRFPDHVNYFTPTTLARLTAEAGFELTRQSFWDRLPLSDNMYAVLGKAA